MMYLESILRVVCYSFVNIFDLDADVQRELVLMQGLEWNSRALQSLYTIYSN